MFTPSLLSTCDITCKGVLTVLKYILRKFLALIPKLLVISIILFMALEAVPGDPLARQMDPEAYQKLTDYQKEMARENLGLNDPAPVRYFRWLGGMVTGNMGYTSQTKEPIETLLANRLPATFELALWALVLSTVLSMLMGFACALNKNSPLDYLFQTSGVVAVSVPEFFFAICMMFIFAIELKWFPAGGRIPPEGKSRFFVLFLPIATLTLMKTGGGRSVRAVLLDVMEKDYVKTARSKGISEFKVNVKHILRNAMIPTVTGMVMSLTALVGGSVIIEQVYNYIGLGSLALSAETTGDTQLVLTLTMMVAVISLICSVLADIALALLDPRIRMGK